MTAVHPAVAVCLPASDEFHTLVVGLEIDPDLDRHLIHQRIRLEVDLALDRHFEATGMPLADQALNIGARLAGADLDSLLDRRDNRSNDARNIAYWLLHRHVGWSSPKVGKALGRDHATVLSGARRAEDDPVRLDRAVAAWGGLCEALCGTPSLGGGRWCAGCLRAQAAA